MAASPSTQILSMEDSREYPKDTVQPLIRLCNNDSTPLPMQSHDSSICASSSSQIPMSRMEATMVFLKSGISIDSALLSAMRDSRERFALLKCEQSMIDFIKSDLQEIEVGGAFNSVIIGLSNAPQSRGDSPGRQTSFQRCWLHRLSDRFGIVRESISPEWIRCKKTPESSIPVKLLIDLQPSDYSLEKQATTALSQLSISGNGTGSNKTVKRNKMKIMKRSPSTASNDSNRQDNSKSSSNSAKKGSVTLTEKEKAYADARARIFNNDETEESSTSSALNGLTTDLKPSQVVTKIEHLNDDQTREGRTSQNSTTGATGAVSKVTWRNRQQEESDPDFQRGVLYPTHYQQHQQYAYYAQQYHQQHVQSDQYATAQMTGFRGSGRGRGFGRNYADKRGATETHDFSTFR